ncbi:MAG: tetratricopeptide repeat protein [Caldilineaceae bacterium]
MILSAPTFGEMLRQLRRRAGLTQGELALMVGFSVAQISRLEKEERLPDLEMVVENFLPALALEDEPRLAQRLVELAAAARGERAPTAIIAQRTVRTVIQETMVESDSHLPAALLPLVGRETDLAVISQRLLAAPGRLLTLTGPPGVGKTQLAMTVAAKVQPMFLDGVHFVPLAPITDAEHVAAAIGTTIGLAESEHKAPRAKLIEYLRRKKVLLVLDNFEQVSAAAVLVAELLGECPELRVLVTSQEPLRLRTEQRQRVLPLTPAAAVELFLQRAQAIDPDFAVDGQGDVVAAICLRLDCLPLAIELVAAQLELFTPTQLLTRLQDRQLDLLTDGPHDLPAHQRTLRNAIHRSYALLNAEEQRLFRTLGVFAGGCTVEALAVVRSGATDAAGSDVPAAKLLPTLRTLVRKSLVQQQIFPSSTAGAVAEENQERFTLLTTLAAYATEQLMATGEETACRRNHAGYYLTWAVQANQQLQSGAKRGWLDHLEAEHDNLRAALAWSLHSEPTIALHLVAALGEFWATRGHDYEARRWIDAALAAAPGATATHAAVLLSAGLFARRQADYAVAQAYMNESIACYQALHDDTGLAGALREAGWLAYDLHQKAVTKAHFDASLALYRRLHDNTGIANLLLCLVHLLRNEPEQLPVVQAYLAEALTVLRDLDQADGLVWALQQQGELALATGNYAAAEQHFREVLAHWRPLAAKLNIAWSVALVGEAAALQGDLATAERCYREAHQLFTELGHKDGAANALCHLGEVARRRGDAEQASAYYRESLTLCQTLQNRHVMARCLAGLGGVALAIGQPTTAATLLGAAQRLFGELPPFLPPADQEEITQFITMTRQSLEENAFALAWQVGQTMTTTEAGELLLVERPLA